MINYSEKQEKIYTKATTILQKLDLLNHLSKYGNVSVVGSYALKLMCWEDIDIVVNTKISYRDFLETVNYLFPLPNIYNLNLQDFRKSIYPDRPQGVYCGITYLEKPNTFWKIDLWFSSKNDKTAENLVRTIKPKLNSINTSIILTIKNEMREEGWGKNISGLDVYSAVIENHCTNLDEFKNYLKKLEKIV